MRAWVVSRSWGKGLNERDSLGHRQSGKRRLRVSANLREVARFACVSIHKNTTSPCAYPPFQVLSTEIVLRIAPFRDLTYKWVQELHVNQEAVVTDFDDEGFSATVKFTSQEKQGSMITYLVRGMVSTQAAVRLSVQILIFRPYSRA